MSYVCNRLKAGRKKTVFDLVDKGTKQLQEKRAEYGILDNKEILTPLFLLWSQKKITNDEFAAGCYFEELNYRIKKTAGKFGGSIKSSLAKMQEDHMNDVQKVVSRVPINEKCSSIMGEIKMMINYVHSKALALTEDILINQNLQTMQKMLQLTTKDLAIFRKSLHLTYEYIKANHNLGYIQSYHAKVG